MKIFPRKSKPKSIPILLTAILLLQLPLMAEAKKLYRWWNEEKQAWELSDKIPPEQSKYERSELNEEGRTVKIHEAAKTDEQIKQESLLKVIYREKEKLLSAQQKNDAVLLKTFQREEDIESTLQAKLKTLSSREKLTNDQLEQQLNQLVHEQKQAAGYERDGKAIPQKLLDQLKQTRQVIKDYEQEIAELKTQKQALQDQSEKDKARFATLKTISSKELKITQTGVPSLFIGQIECGDHQTCAELWPTILDYAKSIANTRIRFEGDQLLLTAPASTGDDRSVGLTWVADDLNHLYLDISCKDSEEGRDTCKSDATRKLVEDFDQFGHAD